MTPSPPVQFQEPVHAMLLDARAAILQRKDGMTSAGRELEFDPDGIPLSPYGRDEALTLMIDQDLREIDAALTRLADGTYGLCADCSQPIPPRRLQALPFATLCVPCQSLAESRSRHEGRRAKIA